MYAHTAHNRIVYASPLKRLGFRSARSPTAPTPHSTTFLWLLERLRVPLSQPQKRHIQPKRYMPCTPNMVYGNMN